MQPSLHLAEHRAVGAASHVEALPIVLACHPRLANKVRYTFDSLFLALGMPVVYTETPPEAGPWLLYAQRRAGPHEGRCAVVAHCPASWRLFERGGDADGAETRGDLRVVLAQRAAGLEPQHDIDFDLIANAFYFLASWPERVARGQGSRLTYARSVFARLDIPQDIVDRYAASLGQCVQSLLRRLGLPEPPARAWPQGRSFAVVLSHDVDFLPTRPLDNVLQGARTVLRHLVRQRDPADAVRAARGWLHAMLRGRDPYGCIPDIIRREQRLGVRSSFQVAVARRHPSDVNYRIEDDRTRDYLRAITSAGFDLCLHGSYRSTERAQWYAEEVELLAQRLGRPLGSRQHFLSFDYDVLFQAQEAAGIQYDMSMGFPDRPGARAGCSWPYFPYNLEEDRPYRVLEISLFLMDVTLRSYLGLRPASARRTIDECLSDLRRKRGCASVVWHPIVFGGARDPGYDRLYFELVAQVQADGGLATDGRTINEHWRRLARKYASLRAK